MKVAIAITLAMLLFGCTNNCCPKGCPEKVTLDGEEIDFWSWSKESSDSFITCDYARSGKFVTLRIDN